MNALNLSFFSTRSDSLYDLSKNYGKRFLTILKISLQKCKYASHWDLVFRELIGILKPIVKVLMVDRLKHIIPIFMNVFCHILRVWHQCWESENKILITAHN
jgi:hypothetical protein